MKLKTRVQEVEAVLITEAIGPLRISSNRNVVTTDLVVNVGESLLFDPVRGLQKMSHDDVIQLYTAEGGADVPAVAKAKKKKRPRSRRIGLGNVRTAAPVANGSDSPAVGAADASA